MFNKIFYTFSARFFTALLSLLVVIITARYLGAEARGEISLIMVAITIVILVNNIIGGSALVYLVSRHDLFKLMVPSYAWGLISSVTITSLLDLFGLLPKGFFLDIFLLSFLSSLGAINMSILLGRENIKLHNIISFLQVLLLAISLWFYLFFLDQRLISSYLYALYISYFFIFIMSLIPIIKELKVVTPGNQTDIIKSLIKPGIYIQLANILQLINYRFSYYLIDHWQGTAALGVYSVGVSLAEAVWIISKSIALVQYARVANSNNREYAQKLTVKLIKLSYMGTLAVLVPLLLLPSSIFIFIFGEEFGEIKMIILGLSPGIISLGISVIFTHYFSGIGKNHINTIASGIGFILTLIFCFLLIPLYGIYGAALSASISYFISGLYLFYIFSKESKSKMISYVPTINDFKLAVGELKKLTKT